MATPILYHSPGACSRVCMNALCEIGLKFELRLINNWVGENTGDDYLALNPNGKVPTFIVGDNTLTENAAILYHLHTQFPEAALLPAEANKFGINKVLEDLFWCSSTLHPMTRMVRKPMRFTTGETEGVKALGIEFWQPVLARLNTRFSEGEWWYGSKWSIMDVYLNWALALAAGGGLELSAHPEILRHDNSVRSRASYISALQQEVAAMQGRGIEIPEAWR